MKKKLPQSNKKAFCCTAKSVLQSPLLHRCGQREVGRRPLAGPHRSRHRPGTPPRFHLTLILLQTGPHAGVSQCFPLHLFYIDLFINKRITKFLPAGCVCTDGSAWLGPWQCLPAGTCRGGEHRDGGCCFRTGKPLPAPPVQFVGELGQTWAEEIQNNTSNLVMQ